jgi:hypothetical protein
VRVLHERDLHQKRPLRNGTRSPTLMRKRLRHRLGVGDIIVFFVISSCLLGLSCLCSNKLAFYLSPHVLILHVNADQGPYRR